jgi:plastocyanin
MFRAITTTLLMCTSLLGQGAWGEQIGNTISVITTDFKFEPNTWTVAGGQPVTLTITNRGANEHEWVLLKKETAITPPFGEKDEDKVFWEIEIEPGATKTATFTVPKEAGTYQVICGTPMHLEQGMKATLVVK